VENNLVGLDYRDQVMDPDNMDFRPVKRSAAEKNKVGPYETSARFYWIPGRQEDRASSPVPPNGAESVVASRRRHLMWLNAYKSNTHLVGGPGIVCFLFLYRRLYLDDFILDVLSSNYRVILDENEGTELYNTLLSRNYRKFISIISITFNSNSARFILERA
jgi:hypothetical protein